MSMIALRSTKYLPSCQLQLICSASRPWYARRCPLLSPNLVPGFSLYPFGFAFPFDATLKKDPENQNVAKRTWIPKLKVDIVMARPL